MEQINMKNSIKTITTNSNMITIIDVGMYETELDPRYMLDDLCEYNNFDGDIDINMQSYKSELAETIEAYYQNVKFGLLVLHDFGDIHSPREYNFETDSIDFKISYSLDMLLTWINDNKEHVMKHLQEHHTTKPGYYSYVKTDWHDFIHAIQNNEAREVSVALNFYLSQEYDDEFEELYDQIVHNMTEWVAWNYYEVKDSEVV